MLVAQKGDTVKVHYRGRLKTGEIFDTSENGDPFVFEIGSGNVIQGFDDGVNGMQVGQKKTIEIDYMHAYGPRYPNLVIEVPRGEFPQEMELHVGDELIMTDKDEEQIPVVITEIKEHSVVLDANHPLAGQDLIFEVELVEIIKGKSPLIVVP